MKMTLSKKFLLVSIAAILIVPLIVGETLYRRLKSQRLDIITIEIDRELGHIEFALSRFLEDRENDLYALAMNPIVRTRDDSDWTCFLDADEETFEYDYGPIEKEIIGVFNTFRISHPYVNSVYMGRENGTFVRSHERARPTKYDPRSRPWYIAAKEKPGDIVRTYPYQSVTTPDINIGLVTTLRDSEETVFGVVGMDVTLVNLTDYISQCRIGRNGQIILTYADGVILACRNMDLLFHPIDTLIGEMSAEFLAGDNGRIRFRDATGTYFLFYRSSKDIGLKVGIILPEEQINTEIKSATIPTMFEVFVGIGLVSLLLLIGLRQFVHKPLRKLTKSIAEIGHTGDLTNRVDIDSTDEFGELAVSFNAMIQKLQETRNSLERADEKLRKRSNNLEQKVKKRTAELEELRKEAVQSMQEAVEQRRRAEEVSGKLANSYEKLQKLEKLRDDLTNMIVHDMRNPLMAISTSIELLSAGELVKSVEDDIFNVLETSSTELINMVETLLDVTRLEQGKMPVNISQCNLKEIVAETVDSMRTIAECAKVTIEVSGEYLSVKADENLIRRVLTNLLNNAVRYNPTGESIEVSFRREGDSVRVEVRDKGQGIPEKYRDIIFKKFEQVDLRQANIKRSTGLGLAFCKMAVEAQGGEIGVNSELGNGSVFWFVLPIGDNPSEDS